jgi:methylenetetrahydrofolate reductase (NADPH)
MAQSIHFSFELFPPRTAEGAQKLPGVVNRLAAVGPEFFSVTYGAGGSDQAGTYDTVCRVVADTGIEAAPHLTCVGSTRSEERRVGKECRRLCRSRWSPYH